MEELSELRVLYVEDDELILRSLEKVFKKIFGESLIATNGQEGLEAFKQLQNSGKQIDVVISDINMPRMNGLDMIERIRELDEHVPIVVTTAHSDSNFLMQAIELNVSEYVVKPLDVSTLIKKIEKAYLPIKQKKQLELKNIELQMLNEKIKETAKQEMENILNGESYLSSEYEGFGEFLDSITVER